MAKEIVHESSGKMSATWNAVLGQDMVAMEHLVAASGDDTMAIFIDPSTGLASALMIGKDQKAYWLGRAKETGWALTPTFERLTPKNVAVGVGHYDDDGGTLHAFVNDGAAITVATFDASQKVWSVNRLIQEPVQMVRVCNLPDSKDLLLHGLLNDGTLYTALQSDDFQVRRHEGKNYAGLDWFLFASSEDDWTVGYRKDGELHKDQGGLAGHRGRTARVASSVQFDKLVHVYQYGTKVVFVAVGTDGEVRYAFDDDSDPVVISALKNVVWASSHVAADDSGSPMRLDLFAVDRANNLWVCHPSQDTPLAVAIPIGVGVDRVANHTTPQAVTTMFSRAPDGTVQFHSLDAKSSTWVTGPVTVASATAKEETRYRVRATVTNADGTPAALTKVNLALKNQDSAVEVEIGGTRYTLGGAMAVDTITDQSGGLTLTFAATGLSAPVLVLGGEGLSDVEINPGGPLRDYFSGKGELNPFNPDGGLPTFSGDVVRTMGKGKDIDQSTADSIADTVAWIHTGKPSSAGKEVVGTIFRRVDGRLQIVHCHTAHELARERANLGYTGASNGISDWLADAWSAATNFFSGLVSLAVDWVNKVVDFTISVGGELIQFLKVAWSTIEQAASFVYSVLSTIVEAIEDVIEFFKALFDLEAIWRTKKKLVGTFNDFLGALEQRIGTIKGELLRWFDDGKAAVDQRIDELIDELKKKPKDLQVPTDQTRIGQVTWGDQRSDPHHRWLTEKLHAHAGTALETLKPRTRTSTQDKLKTLLQDLQQAVATVGGDFAQVFEDLRDGLEQLFKDPSSFLDTVLITLLKVVKDAINLCFDVGRAVVQIALDILAVAFAALQEVLTTKLDVPILGDIWSWLANKAGEPEDELTVGNLFGVAVAFPMTILFKLISGGKEPFPDASQHRVEPTGAAGPVLGTNWPFVMAGIVQLIGIGSACVGLIAEDERRLAGGAHAVTIATGILSFVLTLVGEYGDATLEHVSDAEVIGLAAEVIGLAADIAEALEWLTKEASCTVATHVGFIKTIVAWFNGETPMWVKICQTMNGLQLVSTQLEAIDNPEVWPWRLLAIFFGNGAAAAIPILVGTTGGSGGET